jgi:hypothetical protein
MTVINCGGAGIRHVFLRSGVRIVRRMRLGGVCGNIAHAILLLPVSWRRACKVKAEQVAALSTGSV